MRLAPEEGRRWREIVRLLCAITGALAVIAFAFWPALDAGFVWDDRADVLDNPAASPGGFVAALGTTNRPLVKASYALQRAWTGADPRPFHLANLLLHLATAVAVALLARRIVGEHRRATTAVSLGAVTIWALHPATVDAVAPVSGRSMLLSTLLLISSLLLVTGAEPPRRSAALAAALCAFGAPLAKETALVLPALLALWQVTLGAGETRERALRRWMPLLGGWTPALAAIAASERHRELVAFSLAQRSPLDALLGNLHALFELGRLWLVPSGLSIDPAAPAAAAWGSSSTLAKLALVAAVAVAVFALRRRRPGLAFALGWPLLALAPSNSVVWRLDPVAPRALYLASIGPILLLALGLARALAAARASAREGNSAHARPAFRLTGAFAATGLTALALDLGTATHARAALFADPVALWADAAEKSPGGARAWLNLGVELMLADRIDEAERALETAYALDPLEGRAACALDAVRIRRSASRFASERRSTS